MSHYEQDLHPVRTLGLKRPAILAIVALLAIVAVMAIVVAQGGGGGQNDAAARAVSPTSGPNETSRGISAARAAGASDAQPAGGPDETLRGRVYEETHSAR
jgi:hypothetical protein